MTEPTQNTRWWEEEFNKKFLYFSGDPRKVLPGITEEKLKSFIKHIEDTTKEIERTRAEVIVRNYDQSTDNEAGFEIRIKEVTRFFNDLRGKP